MADYTRKVKKLLSTNGCYFVRQGNGDHEIWYSPISNKQFTVDGSIKRTSANETLKDAGIAQKIYIISDTQHNPLIFYFILNAGFAFRILFKFVMGIQK